MSDTVKVIGDRIRLIRTERGFSYRRISRKSRHKYNSFRSYRKRRNNTQIG